MITAETIRQALRCDNPSCACHKPTGHVHCPAHEDDNPSLHVVEKNSKVLIKCFAGSPQDAVIKALKDRGSWPAGKGNDFMKVRVNKSVGKGCNTATPPGLTLEELAKAKGLQINGPKGLTAWGVAQQKYCGATVIRIPYFSPDGQEVAVRYRKALTGDNRFSWRRGDRVCLYGLSRQPRDWCLLVEGETDCWTAWAHDLPALGLPGASTWRPEWAEHFMGKDVYLWEEPDEAGRALPAKIGKDLPGLMVIRAPNDFKDLNAAHLAGVDIPALVEKLKAQAIPAAEIIKTQADKRLAELQEKARPVLEAVDPLSLVSKALRAGGYGGDLTPALIIYLAVTSRLLAMRPGAMPVHLVIVSQASAGKSFTLQSVLRLLPDEAHNTIPAGSPRVLIYDDADLQHRAIIFGEADSLPAGEDNPAASAIRNLLQDHSLQYDVTVKDPNTGTFVVKKVRKEGPTMLVTTSTRRLGYQLDTRVFTLHVGDSREKISAALEAQAEVELNGAAPPDETLIAFQAFLQVQAPWDVYIPFVKPLSSLIGKRASAPRILRDFARLVSLVKSIAVLRQAHRKRDTKGRLIAAIEDYATVYELVGPMFEATLTGATKELRATVQAVEAMLDKGEPITATSLSGRLGINRGTASRRVAAAIKRGWLINRETRRGQPWDLALGEPLPDQEGLPTPDEVLHHQSFRATPGAAPYPVDITKDAGECCTVARFTADKEKVFSRRITPGEEVPVCGGCRHFQPSPVNPPQGFGVCGLASLGKRPGAYPKMSACPYHEAAGDLGNLEAGPDELDVINENGHEHLTEVLL